MFVIVAVMMFVLVINVVTIVLSENVAVKARDVSPYSSHGTVFGDH